ncbi:hypothetical protein NKI56_27895 [Mesorhizobium sp. M0622]|uniref:hypothetical protein n=1 Tax=Mesorhizobium sp. M0622 TaxID=2956975 RepID=UPI00333C3D65
MEKAKIAEDRRKENGPWTLAAAPLHHKVQLALAASWPSDAATYGDILKVPHGILRPLLVVPGK